MPIAYNAEKKIFRLDSATAGYALQVGPFDYLQHLYFGIRPEDIDLDYLFYTCSHASFSPLVEMDQRFSKDTARLVHP